jgi:hypothetical protein
MSRKSAFNRVSLCYALGCSPLAAQIFAEGLITARNSRSLRRPTHKVTGAPPRLPPRMTRLVFTRTNSVPSRNNRCKLDHSGRADTGRRKHVGGFSLGNFHKGMNHDGIELRAATLYQTSPGVFM